MPLKLISPGGGSVILSAPSTGSTYTLTVPAVNANVVTDTANSVTQSMMSSGLAGNGPAFSAYGSGAVSVASSTFVKITWPNEDFDTANCFSNSTFTPNVAGYYMLNASIVGGGQSNGSLGITLYKNGSRYNDGGWAPFQSAASTTVTYSHIVYANGSTDYFEIYGMHTYSGTLSIGSSNYLYKFTGFLARAA